MALEYSRIGNNQFNISPMKIPQKPFCKFLNESYPDYEYIFEGKTNFPKVGSEGFCPVPAGHYWFRNVLFDATKVVSVAPEGFWRATMLFKGPMGTADLVIYAKLSRELFW